MFLLRLARFALLGSAASMAARALRGLHGRRRTRGTGARRTRPSLAGRRTGGAEVVDVRVTRHPAKIAKNLFQFLFQS